MTNSKGGIHLRGLPALSLLVLALAACSGDRDPAADAVATPPPAATTASPAPVPAATPTAPVPAAAANLARFDGYGDLRFGMSAAEARQAWGGTLDGVAAEDGACYHLSPRGVPAPADFALMIENDRFVRYSTESDRYVAPGGGQVGMGTSELQALYHNGLQASPHKYSDGKYLSIDASGVAPSKLVFETDAAGKVTEWRVGVTPQVDYVEGCS